MKSKVVLLGLVTLALLCHDPAEAKRHKHKRKYHRLNVSQSMHFAIKDVVLPDLDEFPPTAMAYREVPPVGSEESIRAVRGMSTSLGVIASAEPAMSAAVPVTAPTPAPLAARSAPVVEVIPRDTPARFDLVVNNAPASQVFLQLGSGSHYNMLVPPDLSGTITLSLKNTTVTEALEALRELFGYDFRITGNRVFVYPNTVQTRIYKINYLPGRRQGASDLRVSSTSIAGMNKGAAGGATGAAGSTGATSSSSSNGQDDDTAHVRTTSNSDFWREVQDSLVSMIGTVGGRSVVLNPAAGVVVIRATPAELRHVADYLRAVQLTIERQVMLEAKIIEVSLRQEAQSGVNWSLFRGVSNGSTRGGVGIAGGGATLTNALGGTMQGPGVTVNPGASLVTDALGKGFYGLTIQSANFAALINFLETQGDVQVLSSPRIATLNNQKAVLKVGSDELYVTNVTAVTSVTSTGNNGSTSNTVPTVELKPFFSGIVLDVTPQIDNAGVVMLHVHPSISTVTEKEKSLSLGLQGSYKLPLPVSSINETDSIVRVRDGHIVAIGGLMTQESTADKTGVQGLSNVPVVGGLFRQKSTLHYKRELVVLIKPTVIAEDGSGWSDSQPATPMIAQ